MQWRHDDGGEVLAAAEEQLSEGRHRAPETDMTYRQSCGMLSWCILAHDRSDLAQKQQRAVHQRLVLGSGTIGEPVLADPGDLARFAL